MSFFSVSSSKEPKDRPTIYSGFLEYFGDITNLDDFMERFEKHLICDKDNCDCKDKYEIMKTQFIQYQKLSVSLNEFCQNKTNPNNNIFKIGMLPVDLWKLSLDDLYKNWNSGDLNDDGKIQFDGDSLCIYGESDNSYNSIEKDYVIIKIKNGDIDIAVAGEDKKISFLSEPIMKIRSNWNTR